MRELQFHDCAPATFYLNRLEAQYIYEHDIPAYFKHGIDLRAGDTVLDVGANIGLFAIAVYQRYGPDINIYAFEPIPAVFEILCQNKERHSLERLRTFPFGLSDKSETLRFSYFPRLTCRSSSYLDRSALSAERSRFKPFLLDEIEHGRLLPILRWLPRSACAMVLDGVQLWLFKMKQIACEVRPLSETIREQGITRIDLLKVDVEGAERAVLKGIEGPDWRKIRQIIVEVEHFREQSPSVVALLDNQGFEQVELDEPDEVLRRGDVGMVYARR
jgi:FkbM family methyltransferase